jgi:aspartyl-tRNA synthetase
MLQIVKCFRDEDLRADRQPEFTQIDCEMAFVEQEDILSMFEGLTFNQFKLLIAMDMKALPMMSYEDAMKFYGIDKPDLRFGMQIQELNDAAKGKGFNVFDSVPYIAALALEGKADAYSNKEIKELTEWVQRPQIGAKGLVQVKYTLDGTFKSSVDKFYSQKTSKPGQSWSKTNQEISYSSYVANRKRPASNWANCAWSLAGGMA